jgi:tRNA uridine 5-carboxymethylaminomethyl modification enzyme
MRLSPLGREIRLLPERNHQRFLGKREAVEREITRLKSTRAGPDLLEQILKRPEVRYHDLPSRNVDLSEEVVQQVEISVKYAGYIVRQAIEVEKFKGLEAKQIPSWLDFETIPSLRTEARVKLSKIRPLTLGQAARISGVSPADIAIVMVWMKRGQPAKPDSQAFDLV